MTRPRARAARLLLALAVLPLFTCAGPRVSVRKPDASLTIDCRIDVARIYIDDAFVGRAAIVGGRPLPVRSGTRRIEVRADGYFTVYREIALAPGQARREQVPLLRVPEGEPPP